MAALDNTRPDSGRMDHWGGTPARDRVGYVGRNHCSPRRKPKSVPSVRWRVPCSGSTLAAGGNARKEPLQ